jgi:PAP2 superfamily
MNPVLYWNAVLLEASRRDFTRGFINMQQPGPIRTSRAMAIVHLAIHDAVAFRRGKPAAAYLNKKGVVHGVGAPPAGTLEDVIEGAAFTALVSMYPRYESYFRDSLGGFKPVDFNYGKQVAEALLTHRSTDGSNISVTDSQPSNPLYGQHRADPYQPGQPRLGPAWGNVTRFVGANHQPLAPFPGHGTTDYLADPDYLLDFKEARDYGAASRNKRSAEQQRIGVYWGYDGVVNLGVPPRLYNQVARKVAEGHALSIEKTAELFAEVNVSMADAGIDAWHHKYVYDLWRPVVGIRNDKAPDADPFWAPLGAPQTNSTGRTTLTPPFPAYPSGHATFGACVMQVLRLYLKTAPGAISLGDVLAVETGALPAIAKEEFTFVSDELDGIAADPDGSTRTRVEKTFSTFAEAIWENSVSRIYLGVHWRFDGIPRDPTKIIGGVPLGLAIGVETHQFFNAGASLG